MIGTSFIAKLFDQIDIVLLVLQRPVVQRQIAVFALAILVAWLLSDRVPGLIQRLLPEDLTRPGGSSARRRLRRWLRALEHTYFPILTIALSEGSMALFRLNGWRVGLFEQGLVFFWLLLIYRLVVTLLYAGQPERLARSYHRRLLLPLFLLLVFFGLNRAASGIVDVAGIRLFTLADREITVGAIYVAAFVLYLFLTLSWVVQLVLSKYVLPKMDADPGVTNTILTISQYVVIIAGILATLASLGLDLSTLAIIGAGLSVGIGFGLQELVANFISGILLLFEQSIRPGDVVQVEGQIGTVEKLRIRSTTVRTFDNIEVIVPNQSLLTSAVTTYTHTNRSVRIRLPVGAGYNSDPSEVRDVLLKAAERHGLIKSNPAPVVFFESYGASSIDFELAVWIEDLEFMRKVRSDLYFIIWEEFAKRGIEIPFPQRDLHLRSGIPWEKLLEHSVARIDENGREEPDGQENDGPQAPNSTSGKEAEETKPR